MEEQVIQEPIQQDNPVIEDTALEVVEQQPEIEDDSEEIEHGGAKYKIPRALKDAFLMQSDYTRKTQEVAEQRKALEAQQQELTKKTEIQQQHTEDVAKLHYLDGQLKQFEGVDWKTLTESDPIQAQQLFIMYNQAKDEKNSLTQAIQQRNYQSTLERQQNIAKTVAEGQAILKRDIKDWSPELAGKIGEFAINKFGLDRETVNQIYDPRFVKILHAAYVGDQIINKSKSAKPVEQEVKPVTKVSGNRSMPEKGPGEMPDAEYAVWRKKGRR